MSDTESFPLTFADARRALDSGDATCEAMAGAFLERIEAENETLNALSHVDTAGARSYAQRLDRRRSEGNGDDAGPLAGLVLAVRDLLSMRGEAFTCSSKMLAGSFTARFDAAAVERLREAGALLIGRAAGDEFGIGTSGRTSCHGSVQHPAGEGYVPGGGPAAAVAAGLCHAALDSDTGGGLRRSAAFCGLVGLRPTYGRVPRHGLAAPAPSFDTVGPVARSVEDVARLLAVLAGADTRDATSAEVDVPDYLQALRRAPEATLSGLRVGLPQAFAGGTPFARALDDGVRRRIGEVAERLRSAGAETVAVSLPHAEHGLAAYHVLAAAEASSSLARYDGLRYGHRAAQETDGGADGEAGDALARLQARSRSEGFGPEVQRRLLLGAFVRTGEARHRYYEQARRVRTLVADDYDRAFDEVDLVLTPTTPTPAFETSAHEEDSMRTHQSDLFTVGPSLAGVPALSVPAGTHPEAPHLPVGAQFVGRAFDEALLLQVGGALEKLNAEH